jgi:PAS domain S-box-containing protein
MPSSGADTASGGSAVPKEIADASPAIMWVTEPDGACSFISRGWHRLTGQAEGEALGAGWLQALHPDDAVQARHTFLAASANREPFTFDCRIRCADGSYRWFSDIGQPRFRGPAEFLGYVGSIIDIDERKRTENALRERVTEFETLLNVIPVGIGIALDPACLHIRTNPAFARVLGLGRDENASKTAPPEERPASFRCLDESGQEIPDDQLPMQIAAREGRAVHDVEFDIVHDDGRVVRLMEYASPLFDDEGRPRGCVGAFVDVTERRKADVRDKFLVQLDDVIRPMTDAAEILAACCDLLGEQLGADRCVYAQNDEDENTIEIPYDYTRGVSSLVGRHKRTDFGDQALASYRAGKPFIVDHVDTHVPALGDLTSYRKAQISALIASPLFKEGRLVAVMAVHQKHPRRWTSDEIELVRLAVSRCWESVERAKVARDLRASESRFRQLADAMPLIVWTARPDGVLDYYNERWYVFTGFSPGGQGDQSWTPILHPNDVQPCNDVWYESVRTGAAYEIEYRFLDRKSGQYRWFQGRALPVRDAGGAIVKWFGTCIDIDAQKRLAEQRKDLLDGERAARIEAERVGRMKDEFLATLSHELRTPLNAILGWSQIITRDDVEAAVRKQGVSVIERNARSQAKLIDDLLDMNRIVSGKVRLDVQRVKLIDVIEAALETVRPAAEGKRIRMTKVLDPMADAVSGDPHRLQQIVWNLLSNAVKFTPANGQVEVRLERVNNDLEISVSDSGVGIRAEFMPHVFERFRQAEGGTARRHGGLGLGLSIVKQLVELHGGSARVMSPGEGHGTTFTVRLPRTSAIQIGDEDEGERGESAGERPRWTPLLEHPGLAGVRVLVVDDEPDARELLRRVLGEYDADVIMAGSAQEALDMLTDARPDVLVSDIGMPDMDGYDLIRRVRALGERKGGRVRAVALTAYARPEDRTRALLAGYQSHVSKPVDAAEIVAIVAMLAGPTGGGEAADEDTPRADPAASGHAPIGE